METSVREEAQGEEGPAATQLDVSRLRSSSMEIREKGSEFLKEELLKAQKVGSKGGAREPWGLGARLGQLWALTECPEVPHTYQGHWHATPVLATGEVQTKDKPGLPDL